MEPWIGADRIRSEMDRDRARREAVEENTARTARVRVPVQTRGPGEHAWGRPVPLGAVFVEDPVITYGVEVLGSVVKGDFPMVTAGVQGPRWQRDNAGRVVGMWPWVAVDCTADYRLRVWFVVEGMALKTAPGML